MTTRGLRRKPCSPVFILSTNYEYSERFLLPQRLDASRVIEDEGIISHEERTPRCNDHPSPPGVRVRLRDDSPECRSAPDRRGTRRNAETVVRPDAGTESPTAGRCSGQSHPCSILHGGKWGRSLFQISVNQNGDPPSGLRPIPEPPPAAPSAPPATAVALLSPPAKSEEIAQPPPPDPPSVAAGRRGASSGAHPVATIRDGNRHAGSRSPCGGGSVQGKLRPIPGTAPGGPFRSARNGRCAVVAPCEKRGDCPTSSPDPPSVAAGRRGASSGAHPVATIRDGNRHAGSRSPCGGGSVQGKLRPIPGTAPGGPFRSARNGRCAVVAPCEKRGDCPTSSPDPPSVAAGRRGASSGAHPVATIRDGNRHAGSRSPCGGGSVQGKLRPIPGTAPGGPFRSARNGSPPIGERAIIDNKVLSYRARRCPPCLRLGESGIDNRCHGQTRR